jgi:hypothetical protein
MKELVVKTGAAGENPKNEEAAAQIALGAELM